MLIVRNKLKGFGDGAQITGTVIKDSDFTHGMAMNMNFRL
jgi:hypothetical protein